MEISKTHLKLFEEGKEKKRFGKDNPFYGKKHTEKTIHEIKIARSKQIFPFRDSKPELKIQDFLTSLKIGFITHKYMNIKHAYQCDIFIPSKNLIIECDGDFYHMNPNKFSPEDKIYNNGMMAKEKWELDESRTMELIKKGYNMLRLWENEIINMNLNQFQNKIQNINKTI